MSRDREQQFTAMWRENAPRVMAYALRHVDYEVAQAEVERLHHLAEPAPAGDQRDRAR